ncbi:MAG: hypothetical protein M1834_006674 [Cirrosporium novae-zelandiae]|nr:MAG: hypothetical protein M1834_006674 [Cirrosporium novae-zelandiae]
MSSTSVHVEGISSQTTEKEVRDFFSFCGKITSLSITPTSNSPDSSKSATVTFEKETAAKTALLLDHTTLGPSQVHVASAASLGDIAAGAPKPETSGQEDADLAQEDKPRSRIVAEYLAHGYVLSDKAIQNAIALDQKHGISTRFTQALQTFDTKYHATDKAKGIDAKYRITDKANAGWLGLNSYFEKAMGTPTGQRVRTFYTQGDKQVRDIHTEARRLADLKSGKGGEKSETKPVEGTDHTVCSCAGSEGKCGCAPGKCDCGSCPKNTIESSATEHTATGPAANVAATTSVQPLDEKTA